MRHLLDGDFCSPAHRKKYHERLRRSLQQLPSVTAPPAPIAGFHLEMPAVESHGSTGPCSLGFQFNHFTQSPPKYSLQLTPLFGQTFFGPTVASAAAPPLACHRGVTLLEPALPQPNLSPLVRILALAGGSAIDSGDRLMPIGAVHTDAGAPAFPLCSPPVALVARAAQLASPKITLGTLNTWTGDHVADLRHVPLASWTRANLEPLWHAGRVAGDANAFSPAV